MESALTNSNLDTLEIMDTAPANALENIDLILSRNGVSKNSVNERASGTISIANHTARSSWRHISRDCICAVPNFVPL
jgi:predicted methyltransferase